MQKKDDATSGNKLLRLFQFLMANGGKHFQTDLSARLNCSPQTIIRLAREIEAVVGTSLEYGRDGHRRWYRFKPRRQNRLGLNFAELNCLSVYRDLAAPFLSEEEKRRIDSSLFNFSMLMADPSYQGGVARGAEGRFVFTSKGRIDYTGHYEILDSLARALSASLVCLVRYRKAGAREEREHRFAPGRIVSMNGAIYVLGATVSKDCRQINHLISLAVHRIRGIEVTDRRFHFKMPEEDLGMFGLPWHEPRKFAVRFAPGGASDYVRERIWSDQQRLVEQEDGGVVLEFVSRSEPEVTSWVRSFGDEAELIGMDAADLAEPVKNYAQPAGTRSAVLTGGPDPEEARAEETAAEEDAGRETPAEGGSRAQGRQAPGIARMQCPGGVQANAGGMPGEEGKACASAGAMDRESGSAAVQNAGPQPKRRILRPAVRRKAMARIRNA